MTKKKNLYVIDTETGEYLPLTEVKDIQIEEETDLNIEQLEALLDDGWVVDPDDIRNELIESIDKMRDVFLDGIYHVKKADSLENLGKADRITKGEVEAITDKVDVLLNVFYKSCLNEYMSERDDAFASFTPEKLN